MTDRPENLPMQNKKPYETDLLPYMGVWQALQSNRDLSWLARHLDPPDPVIVTRNKRARIHELLEALGPEEKSLTNCMSWQESLVQSGQEIFIFWKFKM